MAKREEMSNVDRAWLRMEEPSNLMMVTALLTTKEHLGYDEFVDLLRDRLMQYDRFRQKVVYERGFLENIYWQDVPNFDPSENVSQTRIKNKNPRKELQDLASELMSTPLDYEKPLWQITLVDNVREGSGLIIRLHHCIADGNALVRVLLSMMSNTKLVTVTDKKTKVTTTEKPSFLDPITDVFLNVWVAAETIVKLSYSVVKNPIKVFGWMKNAIHGTYSLGKLVLRWPDPQTILRGDLQNSKKAAWSDEIDLQIIKDIRKEAGATVNDIIVSAAAGAIRKYLEEKDQDVNGLNIRAAIPVDLRRKNGKLDLGNKFGMVFLSLPIGIKETKKRIKEQKSRMDALKNSPEAFVSFLVLKSVGAAPKEIEDIVINIIGSKTSLVLTNVPGPKKAVYLANKEINNIMFWVPQAGRVGLGISVISYNEKVRIGIATDQNLIPDPQKLIDGFYEELDEMKDTFKISDS